MTIEGRVDLDVSFFTHKKKMALVGVARDEGKNGYI